MLVISFICMLWAQKVMSGSLTVTIPQGTLHGVKETDYYGGSMTNFYGIPFAKAPVGDLRFSAPQPADTWEGELNATTHPSNCFQYNIMTEKFSGNEDCLYLNIFTPGLRDMNVTGPLKSVIIYIPGGGFIIESSVSLGPGLLVHENIILVIIQYRLGALGFLSIQNSSAALPGNAGFKDQVMSFRWVQENIYYFGGNPDSVTIFGNSAGGMSTHLHLLSPMSSGLFHRAIASSGSAFNAYASPPDAEERFIKLSDGVGCGTIDEVAMLACLRLKTPEEVLLSEYKIETLNDMYIGQSATFGLVVENPSHEEAFMLEPILDIVTNGTFNKVPFLTGYTTHEGILALITPLVVTPTFKDVQRLVPYNTGVPRGTSLSTQIGESIQRLYYGHLVPSYSTILNYIDLMTDELILQEMYRAVLRQVAVSDSPIYFYEFNYYTLLNPIPSFVAHEDDTHYLFVTDRTPSFFQPSSDEYIAVYRMVTLWTNFVKTSDPNPATSDPLIPLRWEPVTNKSFKYLKIGPNFALKNNPEDVRMKFWVRLYNKLGVPNL